LEALIMKKSLVVPLESSVLNTRGEFKASIENHSELRSEEPFFDSVATNYISVREALPAGYRMIIISTDKKLANGKHEVKGDDGKIEIFYLYRPKGNDVPSFIDYKADSGHITLTYDSESQRYQGRFKVQIKKMVPGAEPELPLNVDGVYDFKVLNQ
jgi:hypothetical protein